MKQPPLDVQIKEHWRARLSPKQIASRKRKQKASARRRRRNAKRRDGLEVEMLLRECRELLREEPN